MLTSVPYSFIHKKEKKKLWQSCEARTQNSKAQAGTSICKMATITRVHGHKIIPKGLKEIYVCIHLYWNRFFFFLFTCSLGIWTRNTYRDFAETSIRHTYETSKQSLTSCDIFCFMSMGWVCDGSQHLYGNGDGSRRCCKRKRLRKINTTAIYVWRFKVLRLKALIVSVAVEFVVFAYWHLCIKAAA